MLRDVFIITESPNRWIEFKNPGTLESVIDKFVAAVERGGNTSLDAAERSLARVREDLELSRDNTDNANKKLYGRLALGTDEIEAIELALQTVGDDDDRAKIESDLAGVMDKNDHVFGEAISLSPEEQENVNQTVRRLRGIIDAMMDEKIDPKKGLEWIKQLWQGAYDDGIYDQVIDMTGDRFDSFEKEYMRGTDFESMSDPGAGSIDRKSVV